MRYLILLLPAICLAACTGMQTEDHPSTSYKHHIKQHKRLKEIPPDISKKNDAYPIPKNSKQIAKKEASPSITPPGSLMAKKHEAQQKKKAQAQSTPNKRHSMTLQSDAQIKSIDNQTVLLVKSQPKTLLKSMAQALKKANYRILRVDDREKDIFLLDTVSTQGRIDEATPLYRVHLDKEGNHVTQVQVLNEKNHPLTQKHAQHFFNNVQKYLSNT